MLQNYSDPEFCQTHKFWDTAKVLNKKMSDPSLLQSIYLSNGKNILSIMERLVTFPPAFYSIDRQGLRPVVAAAGPDRVRVSESALHSGG